MNLRSIATHGLCAVALLCVTRHASAGVLNPGESGAAGVDMSEFFPLPADLPGEVLAERSQPYEVTATATDPIVGDQFARGVFTSRVVREETSGRLAFYYSVEQTDASVNTDFDGARAGSFASFLTDVYLPQQEDTVTRSADGGTLQFRGDRGFLNDSTFLVRTDATAFDENGSFRLDVSFPLPGLFGNATFAAFQPIADDGPAPNPIPLPPAAWAALATMGGFGAVRRLRRRP